MKINNPKKWDDAIKAANRIYSKRMHNILCDNCHSHVAKILNIYEYSSFSHTMVTVWFYTISRSKYLG